MIKKQMVEIVKKYGAPRSITKVECNSNRWLNPDYSVYISWGKNLNKKIQKEMIGRGTYVVTWRNLWPINIANLRGGSGCSNAKERADKFVLKLEKWAVYALKEKEQK